MADSKLKKTSKFISLVLRHHPEAIVLTLDEHGWADVDRLIAGIDALGKHHLNRELLDEIVRTNEYFECQEKTPEKEK